MLIGMKWPFDKICYNFMHFSQRINSFNYFNCKQQKIHHVPKTFLKALNQYQQIWKTVLFIVEIWIKTVAIQDKVFLLWNGKDKSWLKLNFTYTIVVYMNISITSFHDI